MSTDDLVTSLKGGASMSDLAGQIADQKGLPGAPPP
jgi:hypothetical protein